MNLFEKQQKPFAIKLSDRVKEEIKKEFKTNWYEDDNLNFYFHYPNFYNNKGFKRGGHADSKVNKKYTLITEAEFFGDGNNKLRERFIEQTRAYSEERGWQDDLESAIECEKINDDFADRFFDWANVNAYKYPTTITTAELRQIFKTQHYE